jgi:F-type H+-transporting ATPase subunit b
MPRKTQVIYLLVFLPLFLCFSLAEEKAAGSAWMDFLAKSVNFILLFGGLAFLLAKPLRAFLEGRSAGIKKTIKEAEESRIEAEEKLEGIRRRIGTLEEEILNIKKIGETEGRKERERILERARLEAEKIKTFAQQEIDMRALAALRELRKHAAELAVSLAQAKIEERLTPDIQSRLIDESIEGLGKLHEKSNSG